jgi:hypothetical protein
MPGTLVPTTPAGVLGLLVLAITLIFAVLAVISLAPKPKPRHKPVQLVHVPVTSAETAEDDDNDSVAAV